MRCQPSPKSSKITTSAAASFVTPIRTWISQFTLRPGTAFSFIVWKKNSGFLILQEVIQYQNCCCHGAWRAACLLRIESTDRHRKIFRIFKTRTWKHTTTQFEVDQMSSTNTSHFLFSTFPAWGKKYHSLQVFFDIVSNTRARQASLYSWATSRAWTGKRCGDLHGCPGRTRENSSRGIAPISWRVFG